MGGGGKISGGERLWDRALNRFFTPAKNQNKSGELMAGSAGRSGRRPKPTARKELAGNPGKRALNKDEPVFSPLKGVDVPEWFIEVDLPLATVMWQMTTKELCGQGLLCVTDLSVLERWCVAYEFWRRAVVQVAKQGHVVTGATGGPVKNPQLTAMKEHSSELSTTGSMLGLDPSARSRLIGLAGKGKSDNPFMKMINS